MLKLVIPIGIVVLMVAALFGGLQIARSQATTPGGAEMILQSETQGENIRQISAPEGEAPREPNISFIDSPSATCYQPDSAVDECYINWYYMSVSASPSYIISMTAEINAIGKVARSAGFFQTSMYLPYNMAPNGYKVSCGAMGAGGNPYLGNAYAWTIRARDSAGLKSANYGTVYCPAYTP